MRLLNNNVLTFIALITCISIVSEAGASSTEFQDFERQRAARAAGWKGFNNTGNGNDFGYSAGTNFTGSASGTSEAGGTFSRNRDLAYYADTTLGGVFTLDDTFSAEGEFEYTNPKNDNNDVGLGHFDKSDTDIRYHDFIGILLLEDTDPLFRVFAGVVIAGYAPRINYDDFFYLPINGDYRFRYNYDPDGGDSGNGIVRVEVFNTEGDTRGTASISLTEEERASGATFNAFGLSNGIIDSNRYDWTADIYIDNVSYSVIPPPTVTVGGEATGIAPSYVICSNRTRGKRQKIKIPLAGPTWDCSAAGLQVNPGDKVEMKVFGIAQ